MSAKNKYDWEVELDQLDAARAAKDAPSSTVQPYPDPSATGTGSYPMQSDPNKPLDVWQEFAMRGREPSWGQAVLEAGAEGLVGAGGAGVGFALGGIPGAIIGGGLGAGTGAGAVDYWYNEDPWQALQKGVVAGGGAMVAEGVANKAYRGLDALLSETQLANRGDEAFEAGAQYVRQNIDGDAWFPMASRTAIGDNELGSSARQFYTNAEMAKLDKIAFEQSNYLRNQIGAHGLSVYGGKNGINGRAASIVDTGAKVREQMVNANAQIIADSDGIFGRLRSKLVDSPDARVEAIEQIGGRIDRMKDHYGLHKMGESVPVDGKLVGIVSRLEKSMAKHRPRVEGAHGHIRDVSGRVVDPASEGTFVAPGEFAQDLAGFRSEVGRWLGEQNEIMRRGGAVDQESYNFASELYNDTLMPSLEKFMEPEEIAAWSEFRDFWKTHLGKQQVFTKDFAEITGDKRFFESMVKSKEKWEAADYFFDDNIESKEKWFRDAIINDALTPRGSSNKEFVTLEKFRANIESWKNKMGVKGVADDLFHSDDGIKALEDAEGLLNAMDIVARLDNRLPRDAFNDALNRTFWSGKMPQPLYHAILRVMPKTTGVEQIRLAKTLAAFEAVIGAEAAKQAVEPTGRALSELFGGYQQDETTQIDPGLEQITGQ